ncbi:TPA: superantigen-like protein SSL4 [Staphylococcus aureus]|uniref:superantigen-like protein SSL4 n=1 Tax=Staphylococcus aureus TaxID=1280 RepID=UPI0022A052FB|nr:superantigen-like protein SSL4 [Staphylococcus aureus]MDA5650280.1 superantigen-like protein SSL4 [Staphylococcus aureus]HCS9095504.1 superantigen-like protein SSL4 [Staphylococcus aureus]HCU7934018.1 superantigen-like protein SSL4 [Staphylococcus aureus]HCU8070097.1 superantigen-like protein SSL4 [Staphylococcus aureus]HDK9466728.1 superantigen-like protein SSL4 [Staphylococcus aureus]
MKITTIAKTSLALGLLTTGVITTTTQAANATTPSSTKVEAPQQTANATTPHSTKVETPQQTPNATTPSSTKVETTQAANATTPSSTKVETPQQTPNPPTSPSTKVETPQQTPNPPTSPSTKVETPQQAANATTPSSTKVEVPQSTPLSTKVEAPQSKPNATTPPSSNVDTSPPQSPTTKQVPTEINPKFKDLRAYYTKPSIEFKNEIGIILKKWTTIRFMNVVPDYFIYKIALVGKDDKKYGEGVHRNVDVFVVLEENNYNLEKYSVGGITKSNSKKVDHKAGVRITKEDNKGIISHDVSEFKITKEQISLKELDFKLRKQLIEKNNLYGNVGSGKIVIKMKNGGKYTFELHKKLQENRMADVIDGTNIDNIEVNIK